MSPSLVDVLAVVPGSGTPVGSGFVTGFLIVAGLVGVFVVVMLVRRGGE